MRDAVRDIQLKGVPDRWQLFAVEHA
jgi:hypothetical protein